MLSACGGSDGGGNDEPTRGSQGEGGNIGEAQDPTRQGPVEIDGAEKGGIVKLISNTPLETMDPSEAYYVHSGAILSSLVTRSLTQWSYDPETTSVTLVPDLATDLGTSNEDFTEWTFEIREGIKYEDGTEVTMEDIKFGLERTMDLTTFPESPGGYSAEYYKGGADYKGPYTGKGAELDSIKIDGNKITIEMEKPFPDMPYWMTFTANGPIPKGAKSDPAKYRLHPLATGPYKFAEYTPLKKLKLVRNEHWDPATDPARTAYPDGYEMDFTYAPEKVDEVLLNDRGDAKNTMTIDDIQGPNYRKFLQQAEDRVKHGTTPCTRYWAPDYRKITDIKVRQALAYAYPYRAAIKAGGLIEGVNRVLGGPLMPPGTPGRKDYTPLPEMSGPGETNVEEARRLLEEAGAVGYEIKFLFAQDDDPAVKAKDAIVEGLEAAGFKATAVPTTLENLTTVREDPNADINVRAAGWCSDWPSGGSWFPVLYKDEDTEALGQISHNYAMFEEKDVLDRMKEIQLLPLEEQPEAWGELDQYISDTYFPMFVTSYDGTAWAAGSNVNGNDSDIVFGMPSFKNIWLTQE
jgi:peptide/nickel transport system substrate-binding protein